MRLQLHLLAWTLVGALVGVLVHALAGAGWLGAFLFGVPLGLVAAPVSLSAEYVCRAMPLPGTSRLRVAVTAVTAAIVTAAVWAAAGQGWWRFLERLQLVSPAVSVAPLTPLLIGLGALAYLLALA